MNNVNKTLYIPLYGKALVSKKGIILNDKRAEEIWEREQFPLKGKSRSKWLAYYMSIRSFVFDAWTREKMAELPNAPILHLGCGLDSRSERLCVNKATWYDVDFPLVIDERRRYYTETENYRMLAADIKDTAFIKMLPKSEHAIVILEGVSMYLTTEELKQLFLNLNERFLHLSVLLDCYTPFAAKMSKIKNPVNDVGVYKMYGIENARLLETNTALTFFREHTMTPSCLTDELEGFERFVFKLLYAGKISKRIYKLYEYKS